MPLPRRAAVTLLAIGLGGPGLVGCAPAASPGAEPAPTVTVNVTPAPTPTPSPQTTATVTVTPQATEPAAPAPSRRAPSTAAAQPAPGTYPGYELTIGRRQQFDASVAWVQGTLGQLGYFWIEVDGHFGPQTRDAIISFQKANALVADGRVGRKTWAALAALRS